MFRCYNFWPLRSFLRWFNWVEISAIWGLYNQLCFLRFHYLFILFTFTGFMHQLIWLFALLNGDYFHRIRAFLVLLFLFSLCALFTIRCIHQHFNLFTLVIHLFLNFILLLYNGSANLWRYRLRVLMCQFDFHAFITLFRFVHFLDLVTCTRLNFMTLLQIM